MPRSPQMALTILIAFKRKLCGLSTEEFDASFDRILEFLESVNNERYRLTDYTPEGENVSEESESV